MESKNRRDGDRTGNGRIPRRLCSRLRSRGRAFELCTKCVWNSLLRYCGCDTSSVWALTLPEDISHRGNCITKTSARKWHWKLCSPEHKIKKCNNIQRSFLLLIRTSLPPWRHFIGYSMYSECSSYHISGWTTDFITSSALEEHSHLLSVSCWRVMYMSYT